MTYLKNWADIKQTLDDLGASRFNVVRTKAGQDNNNVFMYDKEKSLEENQQICERLLQRCAGEVLYLVVWRNDGAKTGGCTYTICYDTMPQYAQQTQVAGVAGLYGGVGGVDMESLTKDLTARIKNEYDRMEIERQRKQLEEERKELREEQREFEREKVGTIGVLVDKFAPYIKAVAGKHLDLPKVAGVDSAEDVQAAKIHAVGQEQKEQEQQEEQEIFTNEEADKLFALMERFKKVEPDYLRLIEAVVELAENGDSSYAMAKSVLLK